MKGVSGHDLRGLFRLHNVERISGRPVALSGDLEVGVEAMSHAGPAARVRFLTARSAASRLALVLASLLVLTSSPALAQVDGPPVGSVVLVANTDGQRLNLRAGPAMDQPILARLQSGETLNITGPARTVGMTRWLPVRTADGQAGWVSAEFVVLLRTPTPNTNALVESTPAPPLIGSTGASMEQTEHDSRAEARGKPVDVEAKLKFPEVKGREQEITVWVTRGGVPVPGAIVTLESSDGEEGERFRQLDPTNDQGRTRRSFDVRHEKGTVELQVEAVAPDGGEGRTIISYFKR
jgi:uncharacterized protein YraI